MERLNQKDIQALQKFVCQSYASLNFDDFVFHALSGLAKLVPADLAAYCEMNPETRTSKNWLYPQNYFSPKHEEIWPRVMHEHPVLLNCVQTGDGRAYKISDFLSVGQFHAGALFNEFYRPIHVEDNLCFNLPFPLPTVIGLSYHRERRSFTERDREICNLARPHLDQAWRNARVMTRVRDVLRLHERALEELSGGLILLNARGRVTLMTARARKWIKEFFVGESRAGDKLPESICAWLKCEGQFFPGTSLEFVRTPLVVRRERKKLVIRLLSEAERKFMVLHKTVCPTDSQGIGIPGLTPREAEVLAWIAQGKSNADIATILSASPRTVQKHLEHIFRKLGVESRTAAAVKAMDAITEA
jgi:DNA-binding CsgD family transcriptional regulator